jgi:micrococcal nuclease
MLMFKLTRMLIKGTVRLFGKALLFLAVFAVIASIFFEKAGLFTDAKTPNEVKAVQTGKMYGPYKVERVVDGDTIVVSIDGKSTKVRFIGVDTPESVSSDESNNTAWGKKASNYTKKRLSAAKVYLKYDTQKEDVYGRTLAYVYTKNGKNYAMYNKELVRKGYARAVCYEPNHKYKKEFNKLQKEAKKAKRGFWKDGFKNAFPNK